jgi:hypothetical protein
MAVHVSAVAGLLQMRTSEHAVLNKGAAHWDARLSACQASCRHCFALAALRCQTPHAGGR